MNADMFGLVEHYKLPKMNLFVHHLNYNFNLFQYFSFCFKYCFRFIQVYFQFIIQIFVFLMIIPYFLIIAQ